MTQADALKVIQRRHREWQEFSQRWRFLQDSLEGGDRYRWTAYGRDRRGWPIRNLIRHKREYPDPTDRQLQNQFEYVGGLSTNPISAGTSAYGKGGDPEGTTTDDDYGTRLARTPVPTFLPDAIDAHLSRIYAREVERGDGNPAALTDWWLDVDGKGMTIDQWMIDLIAPLLLACGQIDVLFDHPAAPEGEKVKTMADVNRLGLSACVARHILPENVLDWKLRPDGGYRECLILESSDDDEGNRVANYRHWTATESTLYNGDAEVISSIPHPFGRVPIVRIFVRRRPRCENVGQSKYEVIAELQREFYNRDSELILSDTTQAFPLLQGPEDYVTADGTIPIGPSWLLPKKKNTHGGASTYEGFDVVNFPKDGAESIRKNKGDIRDESDRAAHMTKPAGTAGTSGSTVGQSGLSKRLDQTTGNDALGKVAGVLARAEVEIARMALTVLANGKPSEADYDSIDISYPREFDLMTAPEFAEGIGELQGLMAAAGELPQVEEALLCRYVRLLLPGVDDDEYEKYDDEIAAALVAKKTSADQAAEAAMAAPVLTLKSMTDPVDNSSESVPTAEPPD
jgi:hypothetical protein